MKLNILITFLAIVGLTTQEEAEGERRLRKLRERSENSKGIMAFTAEDFK